MISIRSRARQLSLSAAGILILVLFVGPVFVPQELRADAASRIANLAQYFNSTLSDAWHSAFTSRGSEHHASAPADENRSHSHAGAPVIPAEGEAYLAAADSESLIGIKGLEPGSFIAGTASNSGAGLLSEILKDDNPGSLGGFAAFETDSAAGNGPGSGGAGDRLSGGTGGPAGDAGSASAARPSSASAARPSSGKGTQTGSVTSDNLSSEGTRRPKDAKPDVQKDRITELGDSSIPAYSVSGGSWEQVASSESLNAFLSNNPATGDWRGGPRDELGTNALDPTNPNVVGQLLNVSDHPLQGEDHTGSGFQNEVNGGTHSEDGGGKVPEFQPTSDNHPHVGDRGPLDKPGKISDSDSGSVSSVPEPGSWVLLSLGLGVTILWRTFRPAR